MLFLSTEILSSSLRERPAAHSWQLNSMDHLEWWLEGVLLFITAIVGILGNIVFIAIFCYRKYYINTFHRYNL